MTGERHWRCGRALDAHASWCSEPGGCTHCGGNPCRWWCLGPDRTFSGLNAGNLPYSSGTAWFGSEPARVMEPA